MKLRQPWLIKSICMLGIWLVKALSPTVYCKYWRTGRDYRPSVIPPHERYIYALWHEYLVVPTLKFNHPSFRLLISKHADGMILAEICKHMRMGLVLGSSTRGGAQAIRQLLRPGRYRCVAVTPDGPRGPRRQVQMGIIYLASRLGWPIIPVGVGYHRPWRLKNWDRFAIPKPYHRAAVTSTEPIVVPPNLDREGLETYRRQLEDALNALTAQAEQAAATGRRPFAAAQQPAPPNQAAAA